jgi:hypothetical protein
MKGQHLEKNNAQIIAPIITCVQKLKSNVVRVKEIGEEIRPLWDEKNYAEFTKQFLLRIKEVKNQVPAENEIKEFYHEFPSLADTLLLLFGKAQKFQVNMISDPHATKKADVLLKSIDKFIEELHEWSKPIASAPVKTNQTIVLKVYQVGRKRNYRTIEMKSSQNLVTLHNAIQKAIKWDNDHLYSFFMDNKTNVRKSPYEFAAPDAEIDAKSAMIAIGKFGLVEKQKFAYIFDYGDWHEFELQVVGFDSVDANAKYPRVVTSVGEFGKQYEDFEED